MSSAGADKELPAGVVNLRDVGGLATSGGQRLRRRRLLRSASLSGATPAATEALHALDIFDVLDLRADWEIAEAGPVPGPFHVHRLDLVPDAVRAHAHDLLRRGGLPAYYAHILDAAAPQLVRLVETVAGASEGVLIQCGAGKDRTGVAVAVVLDLVGVDDDTIGEEYARTEGELSALRGRLQLTPGYERSLRSLPSRVMRAPAEAITTALGDLRQRSGSVLDHLVLAGLRTDTVDRLRDRLLTPSDQA